MRLGWVALWGLGTVACGNDLAPVDFAQPFIGDWTCDSGQREIDCDNGYVGKVDLATGPANMIRFTRGTDSALSLELPTRMVVPGLPGGPICQLAFDAYPDMATLPAPATCTDDYGRQVIVAQGSARGGWRPSIMFSLDTEATASDGCRIKNSARCHAQW